MDPPPASPDRSGRQEEPAWDVTTGSRARWLITGGLFLLAAPVTAAFLHLAGVAASGCLADCSDPSPRPLLAVALVAGAAAMSGVWAGMVPWALRRRGLIARTAVLVALLVVGASLLVVFDIGAVA